MSKLIERLEKVDAASTPPLGFGASRTQSKPASMLLVALVDAQPPPSPLTKIQADFCVLSPRPQPLLRLRSRPPSEAA